MALVTNNSLFNNERRTARRKTGDRKLAVAFGRRVLAQDPPMELRLLQKLGLKSADEIEWTHDEIRDMMGGSSFAGFPIAETYDMIFTIDSIVDDLVNAAQNARQMDQLTAAEKTDMAASILRMDFRPEEAHVHMPLGEKDQTGNVKSTGQVLGDPRIYEANAGSGGPVILPASAAPGSSNIRAKTEYEMACDNAKLYSYKHINNIQAASQGLWRVTYTRARFMDNLIPKPTDLLVHRNYWINATETPVQSADGPGAVGAITSDFHYLCAQQPLPSAVGDNHYMENRFKRSEAGGGPKYKVATAAAYESPMEGGAIGPLMIDTKAGGVPTTAKSLDPRTIDSHANALGGVDHPIQNLALFRRIIHELRIDESLWQLYGDVQVIYERAKARAVNGYGYVGRAYSRPMMNQCPSGSGRVFVDEKNRVVKEFIETDTGPVRNPSAITRKCMPLYEKSSAHRFSAQAVLGGRARARAAPRARARAAPRARAKPTARARATTGGKVSGKAPSSKTKTSRMHDGRVVWKSAHGLFVQRKSKVTGKIRREYI